MTWLPIDEAPRDGKRIVLLNKESGVSSTAYWAHWLIDGKYGVWVSWPYIHGDPTHFTTLPDSPAPGSEVRP